MEFSEVIKKWELLPEREPLSSDRYHYYRYKVDGTTVVINLKNPRKWPGKQSLVWHAHTNSVSIATGGTATELDKFLEKIDEGKTKLPVGPVAAKKPNISTKRNILNPYTSVTYHSGWQKDKIKYPILAVSQLTSAEKELVASRVKLLTCGLEAKNFVFRPVPDLKNQEGFKLGWGYRDLDLKGQAGVLTYKGVEVAVFYERQLMEVEPAPGDPLPENAIKDPADTWQRLDLVGPSAREANRFIKKRVEKSDELSELNKKRVRTLDALNLYQDKEIKGLRRTIQSLREQKKAKGPSKLKRLGNQEVLERLGELSARLVNVRSSLNEETPIYNEMVAIRGLLQKTALHLGYQFIAPKKGDKVNPTLHEVVELSPKAKPGFVYQTIDHGLAIPKGNKLVKRARVIAGGGKKC